MGESNKLWDCIVCEPGNLMMDLKNEKIFLCIIKSIRL